MNRSADTKRVIVGALLILCLASTSPVLTAGKFFNGEVFTEHDAVLVADDTGQVLYEWQSAKPLLPASLTKLVTAHLAIDKWGLNHRFTTDFFVHEGTLWVKGYGDPYLVSEEIEIISKRLAELDVKTPLAISIDNRYFDIAKAPGRTSVDDPYNAPLAAVSANFNTAMLARRQGKLVSAEPQTPLTSTAKNLAAKIGAKVERVNLVNAENAQRHFAELLQRKSGWEAVPVHINQTLPDDARLLYRHKNSKTMAEVLRGALKYSNNFIANQVFLGLAEAASWGSQTTESVSFEAAESYATKALETQFDWSDFIVREGSGLSRANRFSAQQFTEVLQQLRPYKSLLKEYSISGSKAIVHAKTGSLSDVHSYAGFIELADQHYSFVFNFNRKMPYRYREQLLKKLLGNLAALHLKK